ncbi:hypothetical protein [Pseudorhodobacter sp.]|uniref:hypothetical protein n=1 Tax=Pseudorhodobacter sp. TaxID=1934400 RepID=UPI002648B454|nr:hypothetical protein [Pseudorhodobacter sp.]MDN5786746.1 hypothetical protein [Pseudorhodobacter sp.]
MFASRRFLTAAIAAVQISCAGMVLAQTGNIELELNTANDEGQGCRLTYVATNNTAVALEKSSYEVAVYNTEGIVQRLLVLEFGWLPVGKTRVVQFDLPDQGCATISRISVNGPVECLSEAGPENVCRDQQLLSSRVRTIQFN